MSTTFYVYTCTWKSLLPFAGLTNIFYPSYIVSSMPFYHSVETPPINPADQAGSTIVSVSPEQQAEISFADPLADATVQLASSRGRGPADGDIAGDLAQAQQRIATQTAASSSSAASSKGKAGVSRPSALPPRPLSHPGAVTGASFADCEDTKRSTLW